VQQVLELLATGDISQEDLQTLPKHVLQQLLAISAAAEQQPAGAAAAAAEQQAQQQQRHASGRALGASSKKAAGNNKASKKKAGKKTSSSRSRVGSGEGSEPSLQQPDRPGLWAPCDDDEVVVQPGWGTGAGGRRSAVASGWSSPAGGVGGAGQSSSPFAFAR
jgi:hypothetical protein